MGPDHMSLEAERWSGKKHICLGLSEYRDASDPTAVSDGCECWKRVTVFEQKFPPGLTDCSLVMEQVLYRSCRTSSAKRMENSNGITTWYGHIITRT